MVLQTLQQESFDVIVGHSQGAILLTALLAQRAISEQDYILNGVAWPNPFTDQLESISLSEDCRILLLCGERDEMNPPAQAQRVQQAFVKAGADVSVIHHPKGHAVPIEDDIVEQIRNWILEKDTVCRSATGVKNDE